MNDLRARYKNVLLFRNEMHLAIYNFDDGQAFYPDFVLLLQEQVDGEVQALQVFIEPKGDHLIENDSWKQDLLMSINDEATVKFESEKYRLVGLPFFNKGEIDPSLSERFVGEYERWIVARLDHPFTPSI
jgi:type III restriction enzyme